MNEEAKPLMVSICCITYNHEPYIRQCLEGFVMQKTNFRFEAIVHDDASTDGTAAIVREYAEKYPDIIKAIIETENQYSKGDGSLGRIMGAACKGKYIALCEGDDYWVDPLKLQKQVDFLEFQPDFGMVFSDYNIFYDDRQKMVKQRLSIPIKNDSDLKWKILSQKYILIATCSILMRSSLYFEIKEQKEDFDGFLMADTQLLFHLARLSKVGHICDITSVYRKHIGGATNTGNLGKSLAFASNVVKMKLQLARKYNAPQWLYDEIAQIDGIPEIVLMVANKQYQNAQNVNLSLTKSKRIAIIISILKLFRISDLRITYYIMKYMS